MSKIQFEDKEKLIGKPHIPEKNKVTEENVNEIKKVVNENDDRLTEVEENTQVGLDLVSERKLLYNVSSSPATDGSNITLNENIYNFRYILVYTGTSTALFGGCLIGGICVDLQQQNQKQISTMKTYSATRTVMQVHNALFNIVNPTTLNLVCCDYSNQTASAVTFSQMWVWRIEGIR